MINHKKPSSKKSSDGLIDLLRRHNLEATGNSKRDIKTAKDFIMPPDYNEFLRGKKND